MVYPIEELKCLDKVGLSACIPFHIILFLLFRCSFSFKEVFFISPVHKREFEVYTRRDDPFTFFPSIICVLLRLAFSYLNANLVYW